MLMAIWTMKSSLKWLQMEMRNLLGTGAKVTLVVLAAFCPHPRDLWNVELERDNLGYLEEEISKQQGILEVTWVTTWVLLKAFSFKREAENKSSENLQPDNVIEKKIPFSEEKFKLAAEICISNEEPNVNPQDKGENVSRVYQKSSQQSLSSQTQRLRRKKWFCGPGPGCLAVCSLGTWCPASQLLQAGLNGAKVWLRLFLQRVQAPSLGSFHVVLSLLMHRSQELKFGNLHLDFRGCIEMPGCPGRSLLQGQGPREEPL
ncbi:hypothetical protein H8958_019201 [Nasalis larvatus]